MFWTTAAGGATTHAHESHLTNKVRYSDVSLVMLLPIETWSAAWSWLVFDVEDVDPVGRACLPVIEQPPGAVRLLDDREAPGTAARNPRQAAGALARTRPRCRAG